MGNTGEILEDNAELFARVAIDNALREFPGDVWHTMRSAGDFPERPRARNPAFYGAFDWHSCVEMHWTLARLLRKFPSLNCGSEIRAMFDDHLTEESIRAEVAFIDHPDNRARQRPYGWGWALMLAEEIHAWDDPDAKRWANILAPLADTVVDLFLGWLADPGTPIRYGIHSNSAFGLSRAHAYAMRLADSGDRRLLDSIRSAAMRWFLEDRDYPAHLEPSGHDFLSPALTQAELMTRFLDPADHAAWLAGFLPGAHEAEPTVLFTPAVVHDYSDGQFAHLHGLNASRAWCFRRLADHLPDDDPIGRHCRVAARVHAEVALPQVVSSDYMVEHWLVAYAVLLLP